MADKIKLIMILHNHQPVGNFGWVFENATNDSYGPYLDILEKHPHIKTGLHTTGPLLEWLEENRPDYLDRIAKLVDKGQVEILGGAFYEPILSKLPDRDKHGQIQMMSDWIGKRFGKRPEGCWVAERIWEPYFASIYGSEGLAYTTLDNTHFRYAGVDDKDIWGSYYTEDQGEGLRVLPIDYKLRYLIPFSEPQETIDYIGALKDRGVTAVTYADDGEKFGVWPGTKKWVYEDKWLERFFSALEENSQWIDIVLPGDYVRSTKPKGLVYLPTASYKEMSEWALPTPSQVQLSEAEKSFEGDDRYDALKPFVRGGFWRNFLSKYPEVHNMYRRMLMVSKEVEDARGKPEYAEAAKYLYRAQCNCGWWHGVFGGLYLNFLRRTIYENLIKAELLVTDRENRAWIADFDGDSYDEVLLKNDSMNLIVAPQQGGAALELDLFQTAFNIFDTMTRREEAYHHLIPEDDDAPVDEHASIHDAIRSKEADIRRFLIYDKYRRLNFIDHFVSQDTSLDAFVSGEWNELGDFINGEYTVATVKNSPSPEVYMSRKGSVRTSAGETAAHVHKRISLAKSGGRLDVLYGVEMDGAPEGLLFGVELNLGLQSGYADDSYIEIPGKKLKDKQLASTGEVEDVKELIITIDWMPLKIKISFSKAAKLLRFPVETVSQSEGGVERSYQNTCLLPLWQPECDNGKCNITLSMEVLS